MLKPVNLQNIISTPPKVTLVAAPPKLYDLALATARTCYSKRLVGVEEIEERHRAQIGPSIFEAGHHTPFQHGHLTFALENVSRQFVWSFLHSHPYYNSEQQSQRYNEMTEIRATVPEVLQGQTREIYEQALVEAWTAYARLGDLLFETTFKKMQPFGRIKEQDDKTIRSEANKKAIEMARYVLPVAAHTVLYHTISGLELHRYWRLVESGDTPSENRQVVAQMKALVQELDPEFFSRIGEDSLALEDLPEFDRSVKTDGDTFAAEFDAGLDEDFYSALVDQSPGAEERIAQGVREVLGVARKNMGDDEALDRALNPSRNALLLDTLNHWTHSPLMRSLNHAHYVFKKRLSHTADSQNQRHRTTPGSKPLLSRVHTSKPDVVTPGLISDNPEALELYRQTCQKLWDAKNRLIELGVPAEFAVYLLPNGVRLRFTESGSLLDLLHKWRMRTCFLAQTEIYEASMQELAAVSAIQPRLTRFIGPPCHFRKDLVEDDGKRGPCPEGDRWCGVPVWLNFPKVKRVF
jgi:thymidylate synthase ThyX